MLIQREGQEAGIQLLIPLEAMQMLFIEHIFVRLARAQWQVSMRGHIIS